VRPTIIDNNAANLANGKYSAPFAIYAQRDDIGHSVGAGDIVEPTIRMSGVRPPTNAFYFNHVSNVVVSDPLQISMANGYSRAFIDGLVSISDRHNQLVYQPGGSYIPTRATYSLKYLSSSIGITIFTPDASFNAGQPDMTFECASLQRMIVRSIAQGSLIDIDGHALAPGRGFDLRVGVIGASITLRPIGRGDFKVVRRVCPWIIESGTK
jgi:hypothetical protein